MRTVEITINEWCEWDNCGGGFGWKFEAKYQPPGHCTANGRAHLTSYQLFEKMPLVLRRRAISKAVRGLMRSLLFIFWKKTPTFTIDLPISQIPSLDLTVQWHSYKMVATLTESDNEVRVELKRLDEPGINLAPSECAEVSDATPTDAPVRGSVSYDELQMLLLTACARLRRAGCDFRKEPSLAAWWDRGMAQQRVSGTRCKCDKEADE